jgi:hypothetical protein
MGGDRAVACRHAGRGNTLLASVLVWAPAGGSAPPRPAALSSLSLPLGCRLQPLHSPVPRQAPLSLHRFGARRLAELDWRRGRALGLRAAALELDSGRSGACKDDELLLRVARR